MRQYETFELRLTGEKRETDWADIDLKAVFSCEGETKAVRGFYDGNGTYVIRFLPRKTGEYTWTVSGIIQAEGHAICEPAAGNHGVVRAEGTHFVFDDGTPFVPFGTTVYALASQDDDLVRETLASLKAGPFNKVRMCVFPKHYDYNSNEPPLYAFEKNPDGSWDVRRPCIAFWQRFERILDEIQSMDIQVDLILFHPYDRWGFAALPQKDNLIYLDVLLRRLAARPGLWWSLANEYDLCMAKSLADWEEIETFVAQNDPYRHLLSSHNCFCFWDFHRPDVTHCSIQTKALTEIPRWIATYRKPVMIDECCYEGNLRHPWGSISGKEMVYRFWRCYASGAFCTHGETFLDEREILWWSRGGKLKGESPERIAFLKSVMQSLPCPLEPETGGLGTLALMSREEMQERIGKAAGFEAMALPSLIRMEDVERVIHLNGEHAWEAHGGEDVYLKFFDRQTAAEYSFTMPEDRLYRVEVIDVWEMTRETVMENVNGEILVKLPGREGMAVLITRI